LSLEQETDRRRNPTKKTERDVGAYWVEGGLVPAISARNTGPVKSSRLTEAALYRGEKTVTKDDSSSGYKGKT